MGTSNRYAAKGGKARFFIANKTIEQQVESCAWLLDPRDVSQKEKDTLRCPSSFGGDIGTRTQDLTDVNRAL